MDIITNEAIENGLKEKGRVYLCGNLALPNGLEHIQTDGYEIGISYYDDFSADKPHLHSYNTEYNYVIEGEIKILLLQEGTELHLKKGDLFVIHSNEPHLLLYCSHSKVSLRQQHTAIAVDCELLHVCHELSEYHLVFCIPLVKAAPEQVQLFIPAAFGVQDKTVLIDILAQHHPLAALGLQDTAETGRQENPSFAVCLCFYVAYETHIIPLK